MAALKKFSRVAGVGLSIVLLAGMLFSAAPMKALTSPVVTVDNPQPGQESAYTIRFDVEQQLTMTHQIVVTFPFGTVLNNPVASIQASDGWVNGNYAPASFNDVGISSNPSARTITVTMGQTDHVGESAQVLITVSSGITNPSDEGVYRLMVQTSFETGMSAPYSIPLGTEEPVTSANVTLGDNAPGAESSYEIEMLTTHELHQFQKISITFPQDTFFYDPVVSIQAGPGLFGGTAYLDSIVKNAAFSTDPQSRTIIVTLGPGDAIASASDVVITISSGILNPGSSGSYMLSILTSASPEPISTNPYQIGIPNSSSRIGVDVENPVLGEESVYSIWLSTNKQLITADTITIEFPEGTMLDNPAGTVLATDGWVNGGWNPSITGSVVFAADQLNHKLTITLGVGDQIGESANILITVQTGITNPVTSGTYSLMVASSQELVPMESMPYTLSANPVTTPGVANPHVSLSNYQISATSSYTLMFSLLSELGPSDAIVITLPEGTTIGSPAGTIQGSDGWVGGSWSSAILSGVNFTSDPQNRTITITLGAGDHVGMSAQIRLVITSGIINPPNRLQYALTVHTSAKQLPVPSNVYQILEPVPVPLPGIVTMYNPSGILINNWVGPNAIATALSSAFPGCIYKLGYGQYTEDVTLPVAGLTIKAEDGLAPEDVKVVGTWTVNSEDNVNPTIIQGLTLRPALSGANVLDISANLTTVKDCIISKSFALFSADEDLIVIQESDVTLQDCSIDTTRGEAVDVGVRVDSGRVDITGCTFTVDESLLGVDDKGIEVSGAGKVFASNCTFMGPSGLGIDFGFGGGMVADSLFVDLNTGISVAGMKDVTVKNNELYLNNTGVYLTSAINNTVVNNLFVDNILKAVDITNSSDYNKMVNNTIVNTGLYGIVCDVPSNNIVTNCILWNNGDDLVNCAATYSDISNGDAGQGNISLDPKFVDPWRGDFHLKSDSPCLDSGINTAVCAQADIDGQTRIVDGDRNGTATVDMGADEYSSEGSVVIAPLDFHGVQTGNYLELVTNIINFGNTSLTVTGMVRESGSPEFTYVGVSTPFTLDPGQSKPLKFRYTPQGEYISDAVISVLTDDAINESVPVTMHGYGVFLLYNPGGGITGDANGDGNVNILDITKIIRIILGFE